MNMSVCALVYLFVDYELAIKQLKRVKSLCCSVICLQMWTFTFTVWHEIKFNTQEGHWFKFYGCSLLQFSSFFPLLASKNYLHGCIYLWSWSKTKTQRPDKKSRAVCAVVLAELQWTNTEIPYLALNTCPGESKSCNQKQWDDNNKLIVLWYL